MRVPYIRFWLNDFYDATDHLEVDVQNTYRTMLDKAWQTGHGSLPNDERAIRLLLRMSAYKWAKRRHLVMPFWTLGEDGRLHNKRLDLEWRKSTDRGFRDKIQPRERGPVVARDLNHQEPNSPMITTRARAAASEAGKNSLPLGRESSSPADQSNSQPPAPRRVLKAHAPRAAPDTSGPGYTLLYPDGDYPPEVLPPRDGT